MAEIATLTFQTMLRAVLMHAITLNNNGHVCKRALNCISHPVGEHLGRLAGVRPERAGETKSAQGLVL